MSLSAHPEGSAPAVTSAKPAAQSVWRLLQDAQSAQDAAASWCDLMREQLEDLAGVDPAAVFAFRWDDAAQRLFPLGASPSRRLPGDLTVTTCEACARTERPTARGALPDGDVPNPGGIMVAAQPILVGDAVWGVVCVEMTPQGQAPMRLGMRRLQWGSAWMRDAFRREAQQDDAAKYASAVEALNTIVAVAERGEFAAAASAAVTDLATRFGCDRVSFGVRRHKKTRVRAISHTAQFSRRMELTRHLAATMDEAVDQRAAVLFSPDAPDDAAFATLAASDLAGHSAAGHVFTVPLYAVDRFVGALVFERPADAPFTPADMDVLEAVATVLAPIMDEKRKNDRWLIFKSVDAAANQLKRLFGPNYLLRKLLIAGAIALIAFFSIARGNYQVSADAQVVGTIERTISPAFDGFIAAAPVRAGDLVTKGDLLVQLDDRDLMLERLRLVTQRERQRIEFDRAVSARDRAEMSIRQTQVDQVKAEIALIDEQIARTRLVAPFDGLVVSGDLSQSIGSAVRRGDPLLVVAPVDAYRVALQVDEKRIAEIGAGQVGALRVTALPQQTFPLRVDRITPVASYAEGATTFEVEALLTQDSGFLLPGMEGIARLDIDERPLIAIWSKPIIDWMRVTAWRWAAVR